MRVIGHGCLQRLLNEAETERVAGRLIEPPNLEKVIFLFCTAQQVEFEEVVDKLHLMMDKSMSLVKASPLPLKSDL